MATRIPTGIEVLGKTLIEMNKRMQKMLRRVRPWRGALPHALSFVKSARIVRKKTCYLLDYRYARAHGSRELAFDDTDYECFVNRLHIDQYADRRKWLSLALRLVQDFAALWARSRRAHLPLNFIISLDR